MATYTPRRQSKKFLDGDCPEGVLAIFDNGGKSFDRYTVFYRAAWEYNHEWYVGYRGMSEHPSDPQGFGIYGEMTRWDMSDYRRRVYHQSCKWSDLPEDVQRVVRADCEESK